VRHDGRALGAHGEALAAKWYVAHGYSVLARNWRSPAGELDLVVGRGPLVVFCEVKARTSPAYGTGVEAVTGVKRTRLRRLAAAWLAANGRPPGSGAREVRFDVVAVHRGVVLDVVEGAF
jgi:putative endonuclease